MSGYDLSLEEIKRLKTNPRKPESIFSLLPYPPLLNYLFTFYYIIMKTNQLTQEQVEYIERLKELRSQIEKRINEKTIEEIYHDTFKMLEGILKKKSEATILKAFKEKMIDQGKLPPRFLDGLKFIAKAKKDLTKENIEEENLKSIEKLILKSFQ